jgi:nucleoside-diphosphate-sugar epimerase
MKRIAILGSTSHIAKNLIHQNHLSGKWNLTLFARDPEAVRVFLESLGTAGGVDVLSTHSFSNIGIPFDGIVNCIGFGTPDKVRKAQDRLFSVSEEIDNDIITILKRDPTTRYINFSSGSVYGTSMTEPVDKGFLSDIELAPMQEAESYRICKIYQEAKHRSLKNLSIVDVRLFNFFSRFIDLSSGYLLTEIAKALKENSYFETSSTHIYRDYVSPQDLYNLLALAFDSPPMNCAIDTYSARYISKTELLDSMGVQFGLRVKLGAVAVIPPTGVKPYYYSINHEAEDLVGYKPTLSSWESIMTELKAMGLV